MVTSLALIFLVGLAAAALCRRIGLPRIIGMLLAGIVLGPFALDALDPNLLAAEVVLFVLVGAAVDVRYTLATGPAALAMIFLALTFRSLGVLAILVTAPLGALGIDAGAPRLLVLSQSGAGNSPGRSVAAPAPSAPSAPDRQGDS